MLPRAFVSAMTRQPVSAAADRILNLLAVAFCAGFIAGMVLVLAVPL